MRVPPPGTTQLVALAKWHISLGQATSVRML